MLKIRPHLYGLRPYLLSRPEMTVLGHHPKEQKLFLNLFVHYLDQAYFLVIGKKTQEKHELKTKFVDIFKKNAIFLKCSLTNIKSY